MGLHCDFENAVFRVWLTRRMEQQSTRSACDEWIQKNVMPELQLPAKIIADLWHKHPAQQSAIARSYCKMMNASADEVADSFESGDIFDKTEWETNYNSHPFLFELVRSGAGGRKSKDNKPAILFN